MKDQFYHSAEFIDDYRLLVTLRSSEDDFLRVVLMNTEKDMGGVPAQTSFQLSPYFDAIGYPSLLLERGAHKPSPGERLAPFHQDPTQRIAVLCVSRSPGSLIFSVETLVQLSEGHEGCEIGWDEWKKHVVAPSIRISGLTGAWVSGCRLFFINSVGDDPNARMVMYDFSKKGRVEHLSEEDHPDLDGVRCLSFAGSNQQLPWDFDELMYINGGGDSVVFPCVSVLHLSLTTRLNEALRVTGQVPNDQPQVGLGDALHVWTF
jgi:hypothetical protein